MRGAVIQANCSIDWGLYGGHTEIGEGTVLDNLVHVAHNVRIGRNCQIMQMSFINPARSITVGVFKQELIEITREVVIAQFF